MNRAVAAETETPPVEAEREGWLQAILAHAPDYLLVVDGEHRIRFVNRGGVERVLGARVEDFVGPAQAAEVSAVITRTFAEGLPGAYASRVESGGEERHYYTRVAPIYRGGVVAEVLLAAMDVTERVLLEREREAREIERRELEKQLAHAQKLEVVGQLTGGIAHDFNNLLTIVLGNLEELGMAPELGEDSRLLVGRSADACLRAAALTHRLLAFARRQTLTPAVYRLADLLDGLRELLVRGLPETVQVELESDGRPLRVAVDRSQLENAVLNLAINARDAMDGHGVIVLRAFAVEANSELCVRRGVEPGSVALSVSDGGVGMAPEVLRRALEPFFTTKDVGQGSGLGLSMVYGFVQQSRGTLHIESTVGQGTTVTLVFPAATAEAESVHPSAPSPRPTARGHGERVLLVEDNAETRELVARQLDSLGYRVEAARDAAEAERLLEEGFVPALVLSDYLLPGGVHGLDVIRAARRRLPALRAVLMSGYTDLHERPEVLRELGAEFLGKPFTLEQLAPRLARALSPE